MKNNNKKRYIGIIDADLIGAKRHRFPNLACMKLSSYHKDVGDDVTLLLSYEGLEIFDKVYISKVFTSTSCPADILERDNVEYGGTGFFYDKASPLPYKIEHAMPDYHLYDDWVSAQIETGKKRSEFSYYLDYSIGYLTRGCFRRCYYCVNRNCKQARMASPLSEFMDESRPKLCFLDDNFLSFEGRDELLAPVLESGKRFQFKQGLDVRLLTKATIKKIATWRYDGEVIFAFDNIEDKNFITWKLGQIRTIVPRWTRGLKFYVFCGCDKQGRYDIEFWKRDISNLFERIFILKSFGCLPYVMRVERVYETEYSRFYASVAAWCNQPSFFKKLTFREFVKKRARGKHISKMWLAIEKIEKLFPTIAAKYYDFRGKQQSYYEWLDLILEVET